MLEIRKISYRYQAGPWIVKNLTFFIQPGEIVGLWGESGSGKTTLAQIIAGYLQPCAGQICIDGESQLSSPIHPVQLVWQHPEQAINPKWRIGKIIEEGGPIDAEVISLLGIKKEWLTRWPGELSAGELQRFCLARALGRNTRYLIADEMTTMLDAITQAQVWQAMLKLAKRRNLGVLCISHDQHLLRKISDRLVSLSDL